jgi:hypothetical protein
MVSGVVDRSATARREVVAAALRLAAVAAATSVGLSLLSFGFGGPQTSLYRVPITLFVGLALIAGWAAARHQVPAGRRSARTVETGGLLLAVACGVVLPNWLLPLLFVPDPVAYFERPRFIAVTLGALVGTVAGLLTATFAARRHALGMVRWVLVVSCAVSAGVIVLRTFHSSLGVLHDDSEAVVRISQLRHLLIVALVTVCAAVASRFWRAWLGKALVAACAGVCGAAALSFALAALSPRRAALTAGFVLEMVVPFVVAGAVGVAVMVRLPGASVLDGRLLATRED